MSILRKLRNDDFSKAAEELQARLQAQLNCWGHDPIQKRAAELELESFHKLVEDWRMLEVWEKLLSKDHSSAIALFHNVYSLRGKWHFLTYNGFKDKKYYRERQSSYKRLKDQFLDFMRAEIYIEDYKKLKETLSDWDEWFEVRDNKEPLYRPLPRKMQSPTSEEVYIQRQLLEDMFIYFNKPNYNLVATVVDVLLGKAEPTAANNVQQNTRDIAKAYSKT